MIDIKEEKIISLKQILYGGGINLVLAMTGMLLMFFFKISLARYFSPSELGLYELLMTIFGIVVILSSLGIPSSIQKFTSEYIVTDKSNLLKGYLRFAVLITTLSSLFFISIVFLLSELIATFFSIDSQFSMFLKVIIFGVLFRVLNEVMMNYLLGKNKVFEGSIGYNVIEKIFLVISLLAIIHFKFRLEALIICTLLSLICSFLVTLYFFNRNKIQSKLTTWDSRMWLYYSLPLLFGGILAYILQWTDNLVIGKFLDSYNLGIYGIAYSLASYLLFISNVFGTLFIPVMSRAYIKNKKLFKENFFQIVKWVFSCTLFAGGLLIFFSEKIVFYLFGEQYIASSTSLVILTVFFILSSPFSFSGFAIIINNNTLFSFKNNAFFAIFNLILNVALIFKFGIIGVAFASGLSFFLMRLSEFIKAKKYGISAEFYVFKVLSKIFVISVSILIAIKLLFLLILNNIFINDFYKISIVLIIYVFLYILLFLKFSIFDEYDFALIKTIETKFGVNLDIIRKILKKYI